MKININVFKNDIIKFLYSYLSEILIGHTCDLILNGVKNDGKITKITYDSEKSVISVFLDNQKNYDIPFSEDSLARIGKSFFYFQTKKHITVIELTD